MRATVWPTKARRDVVTTDRPIPTALGPMLPERGCLILRVLRLIGAASRNWAAEVEIPGIMQIYSEYPAHFFLLH